MTGTSGTSYFLSAENSKDSLLMENFKSPYYQTTKVLTPQNRLVTQNNQSKPGKLSPLREALSAAREIFPSSTKFRRDWTEQKNTSPRDSFNVRSVTPLIEK